MCYRQEREPTYPGYQTFTFLRYVVIHVRRVPFQTYTTHSAPPTPFMGSYVCS